MEQGEQEPRKPVRRIVNYPPGLAAFEDMVAARNMVPKADVARYGLYLLQLIGKHFVDDSTGRSVVKIVNPSTGEPETVLITLDLSVPSDYVPGQEHTESIEIRDLTKEEQPPNSD